MLGKAWGDNDAENKHTDHVVFDGGMDEFDRRFNARVFRRDGHDMATSRRHGRSANRT